MHRHTACGGLPRIETMSESVKNTKNIPISEAAKFLGVSIDTLRRWEKKGLVKATRLHGKDRYFSLKDLEKVKFENPLTISEAGKELGLSPSTLRRLDSRKVLIPNRAQGKERLYSKDQISSFLESEYFLKQKQVQEEIVNPIPEEVNQSEAHQETTHKILGAIAQENKQEVSRLRRVTKIITFSFVLGLAGVVVTIAMLVLMFMLYPQQTAEKLGYDFDDFSLSLQKLNARFVSQLQNNNSDRVLGIATSPESAAENASVFGQVLQPFGNISLSLLKKIDPKQYNWIVPERDIKNVNDIFGIDEQGYLVPKVELKLPSKGGTTIVQQVTSTPSGQVKEQKVVVEVPTVDIFKLTDGIITSIYLADGSVTEGKIADGAVTSAKISDGTIQNEDIADGTISDSKLEQITSINKVAGSAVQLSSTGGLTDNSGLSLLTTCATGQVLAWNGTAWACANGGGGGGGGAGVNSLNSLDGDLTLANSTGSGTTITINNAKADSSTKGIAAFSNSYFSDSVGVISIKAGGISATEIAASSITNSKVSPSAAIAYSKLDLNGSIVNSDISSSAAIAYSKLNLNGAVTNADLVNSTIGLAGNSGTGSVSLGNSVNLTGSGITSVSVTGSTATITSTEADTLASVTARGATTATGISLTENGNTSTSYGLYLKRNTDTSPDGYLIRAQNNVANADLFTVDALGNVTATNFSGSSTGTNTGDQNLFSSIVVATQTTLTANSTTTALNIAAGPGVTLATDNGTKTLTISATGSGDITAVGDVTSGAAFTSGGSGNSLFFNNNTNVGELTATTLTGTRTYTLPDSSGTFTLLGNATTGSGSIVLATSPVLSTPNLGVATATSINKVAITTPATGATLTIADGKTLTASNSLTFTGTDSTSFAFPSSSGTVCTTATCTANGGSLFTLAATSGSNSTISQGGTATLTAGTGISTTNNGAGAVTIANTGVTSVNTGTGALTLNNASAASGGAITINDASTSQKGIASFSSSFFSVPSGVVSIASNSLDFTELKDTLALDANLTINQSTNTWTQNYTGTTGTGLTYNANSLTSGTLMALSSTSIALTGTTTTGAGLLENLDWSPGSATTATGDLFRLHIGANGKTTGQLFNIVNDTSSVFSVNQTQFTTSLPSSFTSSGDVSIANDLQFTNPTQSLIKSYSGLTIQPGDTFSSANLTLRPYNEGSVFIDSSVVTANAQEIAVPLVTSGRGLYVQSGAAANVTGSLAEVAMTDGTGDSSNTGNVLGVTNSGTANANTALYVKNYGGASSTSFRVDDVASDTTPFLIDASGNVGIGKTSPGVLLDVAGATSIAGGAINLNASSNNTTNINTGSSTGAVGIGGGSNNVNVIVANVSSKFLNVSGLATGTASNGLCQDSSGNVITCTYSSASGTVTDSGGSNLNHQIAYFSGTTHDITSNSTFTFDPTQTAGNIFGITGNSMVSGSVASISSTSDNLTTGSLLNLDYSPATGTTATGDLSLIHLGANGSGFLGNLFHIVDNTTNIFSVSKTAFSTSLPANFTAAGDISAAYDLNFTNPTGSFVKSAAPLGIVSGETFNSSNLTLQTYNEGTIAFSSGNITGTSLDYTNSALTTGTGFNFEVDGLTTGTGLNINSSSTAVTSGSLLSVAQTGVTTNQTGKTVALSTSATTGVGAELLDLAANTMTVGTVQVINANALTTGKGLSIVSSSAALTSGNLLNIAQSGATTTQTGATAAFSTTATTNAGARVLSLTGNALTIGAAEEISATALTTGKGLSILGPTGTVFTTGALLTLCGTITTTGCATAFAMAPAAAGTGNGLTMSISDRSSNTTGTSIINGINVALTSNSTGAGGTKTINGLNIGAPTLTACTGAAAVCNINAINITGGTTTASYTQTALNITAANYTTDTVAKIAANGLTTGGAALTITNTNATVGGIGLNMDSGTTTGATYINFTDGATVQGNIQNAAGATVAFNNSSDARIKENIVDTSVGLSDLMKIDVKDFSYISDSTHTMLTGFIAQNLETAFKDAVSTNGDNGTDPLVPGATPWQVDYGRVTPLLVKSIQQLNMKVDQLGNIKVGQSDTANIQTDSGSIIVQSPDGTKSFKIDNQGNAILPGTLTVDRLIAGKIDGLELITDQIKSLQETDATNSALIGKIADQNNVLSTSVASGSAAVSDLSKRIDELMLSYGVSTESSQMEATSSVSMQDIFKDGAAATVSGSLTATSLHIRDSALIESVLNVADMITTRRLIVSDIAEFLSDVVFKGNVSIQGFLSVSPDTAGEATVKKGQDSVNIYFSSSYPEVPFVNASISLEALDNNATLAQKTAYAELQQNILNGGVKFIVTQRSKDGFTIKLDRQTSFDVPFNWTALAQAQK